MSRRLLLLLLPLLPLQFGANAQTQPNTAPVKFHLGRLEAQTLTECSGLIASRKYPNVFWAINDSGNAPVLFAVSREGKHLGQFNVQAQNVDWEDIAADDEGNLYIAETGNNLHKNEPAKIYRLREPDPATAENHDPLRIDQCWTVRFPEAQDCESLLIHGGQAYLIPKELKGRPATVYTFKLDATKSPELKPIATIPVRTPVTAADLSRDGKWLAVLTVTGPNLFQIDGDIARAAKVTPASVFFFSPKMEACTFVPEGLLVGTEDRDIYLFQWKHFGIEPDKEK